MWRKHRQAWEVEESERDREKESGTFFGGHLNYLYGGSPSRLPLASHLASSGMALSCVPGYLLARIDSSTRTYGKLTGCTMVWCPSLL